MKKNTITPNNPSQTNYQILTSFPNTNDKHIDYVLVYENLDSVPNGRFKKKCLANRKIFFDRLQKESFEIYTLEAKSKNDDMTYALLHCATERLLKQAEYINLEMKLKMVCILCFNIIFLSESI